MAIEIERKFLVLNDDWRGQVSEQHRITQGYLVSSLKQDARASVRIRIADDRANINIKSAELGIHRLEYEYELPLDDAREMMANLCHEPVIDKTRNILMHEGHCWEIDEFYGENEGLVVAEIELADIDEDYARPSWLGEEVSDDPRYYNVNLVENPYAAWRES